MRNKSYVFKVEKQHFEESSLDETKKKKKKKKAKKIIDIVQKCKGLNRAFSHFATYSEYKKCLLGIQKSYAQIVKLRAKDHRMFVEEQKKIIFNSLEDKKFTRRKCLHLFPYGSIYATKRKCIQCSKF